MRIIEFAHGNAEDQIFRGIQVGEIPSIEVKAEPHDL